MANIEDEEEDVVVVELEPPKRKKIATLKVWGHCLQSRLQSRVLCFLIRQTVIQTRARIRLLDSVCSEHNSPDSLNHDVDWVEAEQIWCNLPGSYVCMCVLQLYAGDLESEFSQFQDWLQIFPLYKGKACGEDDEEDEEERLMGKYKV